MALTIILVNEQYCFDIKVFNANLYYFFNVV